MMKVYLWCLTSQSKTPTNSLPIHEIYNMQLPFKDRSWSTLELYSTNGKAVRGLRYLGVTSERTTRRKIHYQLKRALLREDPLLFLGQDQGISTMTGYLMRSIWGCTVSWDSPGSELTARISTLRCMQSCQTLPSMFPNNNASPAGKKLESVI